LRALGVGPQRNVINADKASELARSEILRPERWMRTLNIGLIGYGFMGRTHSNAFLQAPRFFDLGCKPVLKAVAARNEDRVKTFAENWGYESYETDWRNLVARKDIDVIDIASPNDTHHEIAIAAAKAGKIVMCEKPLGRNAKEAEAMVAAVEKAGVPNTVWYNYRRVPAVTLIKQLLDEGKFGRIFHYRAKFLQDWTISQDLPQGGEGLWRLDVAVAGSGVTGDLLAHNIDTALWLNGPITEVTAMTETFIKERKHNLTGKVEPVGIDDASAFLCRFENGSLAMFEATRYARGHKALYTLEINGEHASAFWDLHDLHRIQYFDHRDEGRVRGWRSVHITDGDHPYMKHWWVPGLQIGYEHTFIHQFADFASAAIKGQSVAPTFRDGLATDYVTDAVLKSAKSGKWEKTSL
jgi:myo-inositol 2-dehydrogenase/D-chiro-inositol 1-dehydrogenase